MLEFKQVSKSFRDGNQMIQAVKPTDLKIIQGELIAIVGPSGSGKSTFLTMAGALQRPTSGNIYINNKNISILSEKQLSQIRINEIGFILQSTNLVPFLTIEQQFKLLSKYKKDTLSEDAYQKLVKQLNLSDITNQLPNQISGGQKQRVAIAKAIYTNPSIILADEPTASLDTNNAMAVMKILQKQTKERNKTFTITCISYLKIPSQHLL
ncbi:ABC transporter ATP-binding protein [Staphylococcus epidermidis]|nr:ABC transporter ATP-binding protein [Staphylococcus epidermidis]MCG1295841.1 ABC transporter ATP-binding protein [Staphylococcus epidermidis]MCG1476493.1 ABC transporter ATP-binding protein [Staphylococcus epidermidis]MCG1511014.1 ABC transporter ATP-binding protein [Staphylococcus epidermidis]